MRPLAKEDVPVVKAAVKAATIDAQGRPAAGENRRARPKPAKQP